ncbi:archaetidylserine decarboxylase [Zooshikella ganghwensis]|uniref:Phosphatidylserine decarboxylase proenzyme n=1 Tax=Zooshikella ganghwensis TaxID=202772 RepID=A0A4P9VIW3_9GAMM|nr:archaetidylserine decarboxylase [Zooshikella ganghwensis]RDH42496.1 phosphatidylserine decarboxylase [Zooshikella ganghwensis]
MNSKLFVALQRLCPQHLLSRAAYWVAESPSQRFNQAFIKWFIKKYDVNMSEAEHPDPKDYVHFNDFFTRALKEGARPIAEDPAHLVSPADGKISQMGDIEHGQVFQAKGHHFSLCELIGGDFELAQQFNNGHFATIYLSPRDYHRVHMPFAGELEQMIYVPGHLFSVNDATTEALPNLFSRNERVVCVFKTDFGPMIVVLVGAMIVASIETVWTGLVTPPRRRLQRRSYTQEANQPIKLAKGAELGRFKLGSTAIVLLPEQAAQWLPELSAGCPVTMGEAIATRSERPEKPE